MGPMPGLEGLCGRIRLGRGAAGIERLAARFAGRAFSPHRHDVYAIGITSSGVQTFRYRGAQRVCLPGECHVLHPDELHDGAAGGADGFGYRMLYIDPGLVGAALGGGLPFVADPVLPSRRVPAELAAALAAMDEPLDALERVELAVAVADMLRAAAGQNPMPRGLAMAGLQRVREAIAATPWERPEVPALAGMAGLDRWTLARQFRAAFGTSPSRFRTMRQLDFVRQRLRAGVPAAIAAGEAGFADQSHMARAFKLAYGLTPGRWAAALER